MRTTSALAMLFLCVDSMGLADESAPPGESPQLWRASAARMDEDVVIQISRPEYVTPPNVLHPGARVWKNLRPATLGNSARVFRSNGDPMKPDDVLKALAKPTGLAVFVRYTRDELTKPDSFYLAMLHEETCVLVVDAYAILDLRP
jgi:hypothetical protein